MLLSIESSCVYRHLLSSVDISSPDRHSGIFSAQSERWNHIWLIEPSDRFRLLRRDGATWFYTPNNDSWFICSINTAAVSLVNRQRHFIPRPHDELINDAARRRDAALLLCNHFVMQASIITNNHKHSLCFGFLWWWCASCFESDSSHSHFKHS